jgi:lysozyme
MTDSSSPAVPAKSRAAAIAAACALCAPLVLASEGWVRRAAPDPIGIVTACAGHTGPDVVLGRDYTDAECRSLLSADLAKHGRAIDLCIKVQVPLQSRAAFTSFAFNVGSHAFCGSTLNRKLNAGDLRGACAELSKWTLAGGRQLPGLVTRRRNERQLCELGLAQPPAAEGTPS